MKLLLAFATTVLFLTACTTVKGGGPTASVDTPRGSGPVAKTFEKSAARFAACGRESVTVQTGTVQNVSVRFLVTPEGDVQKPRIENMSAPDPDLHDCVLSAVKRMHFPPPRDGKSKDIEHTVVVRSK